MNNILMHGPAFDGSGKIVERHVPKVDVVAFQKAGYELGPLPDHLKLAEILKQQAEASKKVEKKKGKADGPSVD
jgi:hypothetical protein